MTTTVALLSVILHGEIDSSLVALTLVYALSMVRQGTVAHSHTPQAGLFQYTTRLYAEVRVARLLL